MHGTPEGPDGARYRALRFEREGDVLVVSIDHPESALNAVDGLLHDELTRLFADLKREDRARAVVLTGEGRAFSAGGDFAWFPTLSDLERLEHLRRDAKQMIWDLLDVPIPIVAAINGVAVAGGTEILQSTDIRIASSNASFGLSEAQRGLVPGGGSMVRLPRQIPYCKAMEILMTGDRMSAEEAHRIGFVNEVVEPERLMSRAMEFAERLARNAPLALRAIKEAAIRTSGLPLDEAYRIEHELSASVMRSKDAREGPRAFMEKREPLFEGE